MKKLRTRRFWTTLYSAIGFSALFLGWFLLFGQRLAAAHFSSVANAVIAVFALAAGSFFAFCFLPYFQGDRRWFSISALLTVVFCIGSGMLWQTAGTAVIL